jgi:hypothetical protein
MDPKIPVRLLRVIDNIEFMAKEIRSGVENPTPS